jgi:serine/threonine protein kinase
LVFLHGQQLRNRLGGGGFGDVYLCRNVSKSVDCAVKIVRERASDAESEAQKQAQCSHPNVVRLDRVHYNPQAQVRVCLLAAAALMRFVAPSD